MKRIVGTETKVAHTPGPWVLDGKRGSVWQGKVDRKDGLRVAVVDLSVDREAEDQANARLIAAAPELLEALKEALQFSPYQGESEETPFLRRARAVIAKATGGKP